MVKYPETGAIKYIIPGAKLSGNSLIKGATNRKYPAGKLIILK